MVGKPELASVNNLTSPRSDEDAVMAGGRVKVARQAESHVLA